MSFSIRTRSEDYILHKLIDDISRLNNQVKNLYEQQCIKAEVNKGIVHNIKELGFRYAEQLKKEKDKILSLIEQQKLSVKSISKLMDKIQHQLNLLIHMEQASLVIHTGVRRDDLSEMVDVHTMPFEKFRKEVEQVKMLSSSFKILRVELEKQKEYITSFDLDSTTDEHYFFKSEKYESQLSEEEIISISQLREFCNDLSAMINMRLHLKTSSATESDRVASIIVNELKRIKIRKSFFSFSVYRFVKRMVSENVSSKNLRRLIVFLIVFLLSRLKKFRMSLYYAQLRTAVIIYNLLGHQGIKGKQRDLITGAALIANLHELDPAILNKGQVSELSDELQIIKNYYQTVNQIFNDEFTFVNRIIDEYHKSNSEDQEPRLPWVTRGGDLISLVFDFDKELRGCNYSPEEVSKNRDNIRNRLVEKHKDFGSEIDYLINNWGRLLDKKLLMEHL